MQANQDSETDMEVHLWEGPWAKTQGSPPPSLLASCPSSPTQRIGSGLQHRWCHFLALGMDQDLLLGQAAFTSASPTAGQWCRRLGCSRSPLHTAEPGLPGPLLWMPPPQVLKTGYRRLSDGPQRCQPQHWAF